MSKAYELLNIMKGQEVAEVPDSYQRQQITQKELLSLYLEELFRIEVKDIFNYGTNKCPAREV